MAHGWGWIMGTSASGNWENYNMAGEDTNIRNLFSNKFINMVIFLKYLLAGYEFQTLGYQINKCLLYYKATHVLTLY
jgi:hypothetical protein